MLQDPERPLRLFVTVIGQQLQLYLVDYGKSSLRR